MPGETVSDETGENLGGAAGSSIGREWLRGLSAVVPPFRSIGAAFCDYRGTERNLAFDLIDDVSQLGFLERNHRLCLYPSIKGGPQIPLFNASALPRDIVSEHENLVQPPDVYVYGLVGHELGGYGLLSSGGKFFLKGDIIPNYFDNFFAEGSHMLPEIWRGAIFSPQADVIDVDGPVGVAFHPNMVYGHFLLEMLPRLYLLMRLRQFGAAFSLAAPNDCGEWAKNIARIFFKDEEILWYNSKSQRIRARCFILPSMMHETYNFHPEFNVMAEHLALYSIEGAKKRRLGSPRIYLSRSHLSDAWHGIDNEGSVESVLRDLGFDIIHPQEMSFEEQMLCYTSAKMIVCEYGSAAHNSLFSPRGAKVVCINRLNSIQGNIGALRSQPHAFIPPTSGAFWDWRKPAEQQESHYRVDLRILKEVVLAFLAR